METLNGKNLIDLWESWNDRGKLHIDYNFCVDMSIISMYGAYRLEECIIVSLETIFISYYKQTLFSPTPTLRKFGLAIRKSYFWPISQVTIKLEHIGNETINNLIKNMVVCQVQFGMLA
jgi:hypothetical protein